MRLTIALHEKIFAKTSMPEHLQAALYIVPVPIGNREDITLRALNILTNADILACEDTRQTSHLLGLYAIAPAGRLTSYHDHNEHHRAEELIRRVQQGASLALVSDAGSPCISDPGFRLVRAAIEAHVAVVPLPGATAFVPALSASGLPVREFVFMGFAPHKKGRKTFLQRVLQQPATVILYESSHRIGKLLDELLALGAAERQMCIARELTKVHEEFVRGTLEECRRTLAARNTQKGEFVVVLQGHGDSNDGNEGNHYDDHDDHDA